MEAPIVFVFADRVTLIFVRARKSVEILAEQLEDPPRPPRSGERRKSTTCWRWRASSADS